MSKQKPYGWMVSGLPNVWRGSVAKEICQMEVKRIGGTCTAFPIYREPELEFIAVPRDGTEPLMGEALNEPDRIEVEYTAATLRINNDLLTIAALTAERDEYAKAADDMVASHKVERDGLMHAAKLALDALHAVLHDCDDIDMVESNEPGRDIGPWQLSNEAIEALKKAGVTP